MVDGPFFLMLDCVEMLFHLLTAIKCVTREAGRTDNSRGSAQVILLLSNLQFTFSPDSLIG